MLLQAILLNGKSNINKYLIFFNILLIFILYLYISLTDKCSGSILQSKTNNAFSLPLEFNYSMYFTPTPTPTPPIISTISALQHTRFRTILPKPSL
jgi:hypothetical protein